MAFSALEALQAFGAGRQMRLDDRRLAREEETHQRRAQTQANVSTRVQAGDFGGATSAAIAGGEYDLAGTLGRLNETQREQALQEAQLIGGTAEELATITDPAERARQWQARIPLLRQSGYFSDDELGAVDLSDAGLQGYAAFGRNALRILQPRAAQQQPTEFQRNLQFLQREHPEAAADYLARQTEQAPLTVRNDDGTITIIPRVSRSQTRGEMRPARRTPEQLRADADAAIRQGAPREAVEAELQRMLQGGAGPQAPRPFPGPG